MSRRHSLRTAAHWAGCTITALLAAEAAPFPGLYATATALVIGLAVGLLGLALTPQEDNR